MNVIELSWKFNFLLTVFILYFHINEAYYDNITNLTRLIYNKGYFNSWLCLTKYALFRGKISWCSSLFNPICDPLVVVRLCPTKMPDERSFAERFANVAGFSRVHCKKYVQSMYLPDCATVKYQGYDEVSREWNTWQLYHFKLTKKQPVIFTATGGVIDDQTNDGNCDVYMRAHKHYPARTINKDYKGWFSVKLAKWFILAYPMKVYFLYSYTCRGLYSGRGCWWHKVFSKRQYWSEDRQAYKCRKPHSHARITNILLFDKNSTEITYECYFVNVCEFIHTIYCPRQFPECFINGNYSAYCALVLPLYNSTFQNTINITSQVLLRYETIQCGFKSIGNLSLSRLYGVWIPNSTTINVVKITNNLLEIIAFEELEEPIMVDCRIIVQQSVGIYNFRNYFIVASLPTWVELVNLTFGKHNYAYFGQTLDCVTDAFPNSFTLITMKILTGNFLIDGNTTTKDLPITIPDDAKEGILGVTCGIVMVYDQLRPRDYFNWSFEISLKPYIYFDWRDRFRNIYFNDEIIICEHESLITSVVYIKQLIGGVRLKMINNTIFLNVTHGGSFTVVCVMKFLYSSYYFNKILKFDVYKIVTMVCFQMFPRIKGSIVQCNHNGYPLELHNITIQVEDTKFREILSSGGSIYDPFIILPYVSQYSSVIVRCIVTYLALPNTSVNITEHVIFAKSSEDYVWMTPSNADCLFYGNIPNMDEYEILGEHRFHYKQTVHYLSSESDNEILRWNQNCLTIILFIMILAISLKTSVYKRTLFANELKLMKPALVTTRYLIKYRSVGEKIMQIRKTDVRLSFTYSQSINNYLSDLINR